VSCELDHLVIVADSLAQGVAWCERTLGITPGPGGRHALMGTHNRLSLLGGEGFERAYLEIIAIDPEAEPPQRARWFGMDDPALQAAVREQPRLVHMVLRCTQIEMLRWGLINLGVDPGVPMAIERDTPQGRLSWRMLLREDGRHACDGRLPTLIEWGGRHPADAMPASGLSLASISLGGLPDAVHGLLRPRMIQRAPEPGLRVVFEGPSGRVALAAA
jgi:hypothetical protein